MAKLFSSGRVADLIIVFMLVEMVALTLVYRGTGRGVPPRELAASLWAGIALLGALRAALAGSSWEHIAPWLILGLVAHLVYLATRWDADRLS